MEKKLPRKTPTQADHFWRASLRYQNHESLCEQVVQAIENDDDWRFEVLLQAEFRDEDADSFIKAAVGKERWEMFLSLTRKFPEWKSVVRPYEIGEAAVRSGSVPLMRFLIDECELPISHWNDYYLRVAAEEGHWDAVSYLLGKDGASQERLREILITAAGSGQLQLLQQFEKNGTDISWIAGDALAVAAGNGREAVVSWLMEKIPEEDRPELYQRAMLEAARDGYERVVGLLISRGADGRDPEAFQDAVRNGHLVVAERLLAHGADINSEKGRALRYAAYRGEDATVRFLLKHGADPNLREAMETPLTEAVRSGSQSVLQMLLENGADPAFFRFQALKEARREGKRDMARAIVSAYRDGLARVREEKGEEFRNAFGDVYTLQDLREKRGPSGETGLLIAARSGNFSDIVASASGGKLVPEDLFHPEDKIDTVMSALVQHKELQQFFDGRLWRDRSAEMKQAYELLPPPFRKRVSFDAANAERNIRIIQQRARHAPKKPPSV